MDTELRVLVVDDSAVMRELMQALLGRAPGVDVAVAADPIVALQGIARRRPDVILLDLEMPRMDGLTFLERLMAEDPVPVVVCSGHAGPGTEVALRALEKGALEIISKPALSGGQLLEEWAERVLKLLRSAAAAQGFLSERRPRRQRPRVRTPVTPSVPRGGEHVIAIGASTGGTEALRTLLQALPVSTPGVLIVQHMPAGFTAAFADRLNRGCALEVREARDGDVVTPGRALIAPGNRHLCVLGRAGGSYVVGLDGGPEVAGHRPSVDVLFASLARAAGRNAVAALLTGMGSDGARGLLELRRAGAYTFAQDEQSSVIFGMPREAIALGAARAVVSLGSLPQALLEACARSAQDDSEAPGGA